MRNSCRSIHLSTYNTFWTMTACSYFVSLSFLQTTNTLGLTYVKPNINSWFYSYFSRLNGEIKTNPKRYKKAFCFWWKEREKKAVGRQVAMCAYIQVNRWGKKLKTKKKLRIKNENIRNENTNMGNYTHTATSTSIDMLWESERKQPRSAVFVLFEMKMYLVSRKYS